MNEKEKKLYEKHFWKLTFGNMLEYNYGEGLELSSDFKHELKKEMMLIINEFISDSLFGSGIIKEEDLSDDYMEAIGNYVDNNITEDLFGAVFCLHRIGIEKIDDRIKKIKKAHDNLRRVHKSMDDVFHDVDDAFKGK